MSHLPYKLCRLIRTAYTVAKTHLPINKYATLCQLQLCNDTNLTKTLYQEETACSEFIRLISQNLDESLLEKLRQSPALGLMIDESTDLRMEKHLIGYMNYLNNGDLQTSNLTLVKLVAADASVVYNALLSYLRACKIEVSKIYGFSSDGAAVMVGKNNGVATRLKTENPFMLNMHCVAHNLALSSIDAAKSVKEVRYYEGMLHALHSFFSRSSKRLEHLRIWQDVLDDPKVKPLAIHQVRWLSFSNCVTNVRRSLQSLLKSLHCDGDEDPMAESLFHAMTSYKFLFLTHFFSDIMGDIAMVSRKFQERDLSYSDLSEALKVVCDSIEQQYLVEDCTFGKNLSEFLDTYVNAEKFHDFDIKRSHRDARLPEVVSEFAHILKNSLQERFPKLDIWDAMSIFHPSMFPKSAKDNAKFGAKKLTVLLSHYGEKRGSNTPPINANDAEVEWAMFKNHMFAKYERTLDTEDVDPLTVATLTKAMTSSQFEKQFPNMVKLMAICRVMPVSSVECERGFSKQNLIKTRLRCNLGIDMLDQLMRISINGPKLAAFNPLPVFRKWRVGNSENGNSRHIFKNTNKQDKLVQK